MTESAENLKRPDTTPHPGRMLPQTANTKLAMWFFLGGEVILFAALILTFLMFRIQYASDYAIFRQFLNLPLVAINTLILVTSSFFVVRALQAIKQNNQRGLVRNLLVVFALGAIFMGGQAYEWSTLFNNDILPITTFGAPFFVITGIHGSHVLIGMAWACFVTMYGLRDTYSNQEFSGVEFFGLYWHFVDIVWIVLFSVIYLL
ncbi:MAG: cytochrome c oxidase subunit 3 [Chloroflexota bacterium]